MLRLEEYFNSLEWCQGQAPHDGHLEFDRSYMRNHRYRFKELVRDIPRSPSPIKILDIGTTFFTFYIKKVFPHYEVSTLSVTAEFEDWCGTAGLRFRTCDLARQPIPFEDDYFDFVIFTEVLEHVPAPPSQVLREVRRVMRKGGGIVLSVPNIAALHCRLKLLCGVQFLSDPDLPTPHLHEYTMKEIALKLTACDLEILRRKYLRRGRADAFGGFLEGGLLRSLLKAVYHGTGSLRLVPSFGDTIYIECRKPVEGIA